MENLGVTLTESYKGKRVLVTGHTGFKGSWLVSCLKQLGADVYGIALAADTQPSHWELLKLTIKHDELDLREAQTVKQKVAEFNPDIVFHLAAQALVRRSYHEPLETWSSNIMGTANLLDACRFCDNLQAIVVVTSDKCYENHEDLEGYSEADRLGGYDPYSASKAATELLVASYRDSFFTDKKVLVATARAGNVIGGGDWSADRLVPDLIRAIKQQQSLIIRSPKAVRPWQHVLESLSGYLLLGRELLLGHSEKATAWNFGPDRHGEDTVENVLTTFSRYWPALNWTIEQSKQLHETKILRLDSSNAHQQLGWRPLFSLEQAIESTAVWYQAYTEQGKLITDSQIETYMSRAGVNSCQ